MERQDIKNKYPKAYRLYKAHFNNTYHEWSYNFRDLYDFLDRKGIFILLNFHRDETFGYEIRVDKPDPLMVPVLKSLSPLISEYNRIEAEYKAIDEAFKILEGWQNEN
jgi:hypothetical protein